MRICLMIEGQEGVTWEQWLALADACERHGLEGLFRSDHYLPIGSSLDNGSLDAWATLAALAARTETIRLGTLVSPATFRHPSVLAKMAATVDHVSGGRVEVGLGAGWYEEEHRRYGFHFPALRTRMALFAEQLEVVHRSWTEEEFTFEGGDYLLEAARPEPKPLQRPRPPIIVGGAAKRASIDPAVRFADEYNTHGATVEECRVRSRRVADGCRRAGRDPATLPFSLMDTAVLGHDRGEVADRARRFLGDEADAMLAEKAESWVIGTLDEAAERIGALADAGVSRLFLRPPSHEDVDTVELLAELARAT
jgi:F420-dependent oxidoreductase-like protein